MSRDRFVYFIKPVGMGGPVKIGCSYSPDARRNTLDTWSPFALEVVATIKGDEEMERRFHAKFQDTHERREWFTWSQGLEDTIAAIRAGTFDVASLPDPELVCIRGRKRDNSFLTPQWKYHRSVHARMLSATRRGASWSEVFREVPMCWELARMTPEELDAVKPKVEAALAKIVAKFPLPSARIRSAKQAAA